MMRTVTVHLGTCPAMYVLISSSIAQGYAEAQKRADERHRTERLLDAQLRDKTAREVAEAARDAAETAEAASYQAVRNAAADARDAAALERTRQLCESIRQYNECAPGHSRSVTITSRGPTSAFGLVHLFHAYIGGRLELHGALDVWL
jgi:hypothetical protein